MLLMCVCRGILELIAVSVAEDRKLLEQPARGRGRYRRAVRWTKWEVSRQAIARFASLILDLIVSIE